MKKLLPVILILPLFLSAIHVTAQKESAWAFTSVNSSERMIPVKKQKDFELKVDEIASYLGESAESKLSIPTPSGDFHTFNLKESKIMAPALAAKYPNIKAYVGRNPKTGENIRISIGTDGFHAMVFSMEGVYFIDPVSKKDKFKYQVYYKKDLNTELMKKEFYEEDPIIVDKQKFAEVQRKVESGVVERPSGTELRTYRIAIAATGEYTQFHGGTVEDALSAIVTTMTRVNGIYERDIAVTMVLVENNDQLIYTDASNDPFTNNSAGAFIDEVQAEITNIIGSENFDIGHGFSTGAGGLASLGSVCIDSRKASGVTGLSEPINDPYDVDYVAHEIGHQFGAPHTFNGVVGSCAGGNRTASSAYEPGSGSTIMAYAGICGSDNIQNNSDPYFHAASLDFMTVFSQDNDGNSCAETTATGNNLPVVEAGEGGFTIPINTPFQLNGSASDPDGDALTYTWEQFDLGPAGSPNTPEDNAPLFRSFEPTADSFRIFPQLSDILNGSQTQGEILPFYSRDMTFRLTVRDDQSIAGVDYDDVSLSVTEQAGPFTVDEFTGDYAGFSSATVTWEVNNTDIAPVNASFVDIFVSTDGGLTFTEKVVEKTANDGSQAVTLPNVTTETAKFKVSASNNVFFNISPGLFSITESTDPTFTISVSNDLDNYCPTDEVTFTIETQSIFDYNEPIALSFEAISGLSGTFSSATVTPGEASTLTLTNDQELSGEFTLNLTANSGSISKSVELPFTILNVPVAPTIISPTNGEQGLGIRPTLSWDDTNLEAVYNIEVATNSNFSNIIETGSSAEKIFSIQNNLEGSTTYFARVNTENYCGQSGFASISFTTAPISCTEIVSSTVPVSIESSAPNTVESTINICSEGTVEGIEVQNILGTHSWIQDLTFVLVSPAGTEVILLSNVCGGEDDFNFSISDDAADANFSCPPNNGGIYQPESSLSAFLGEDIQGAWTLIVEDAATQDGGELQNWGLALCIGNYEDLEINQPSDISAEVADNGSVLIQWADNADNELGYRIERSVDDNSEYQVLGEVEQNNQSFSDETIEPESTYFYRVQGFNDNCDGAYTEHVEIEILLPLAPSNLEGTVENDYTAKLTWEDNAEDETAYIVERSTGAADFVQVAELPANTEAFEEVLEIAEYRYRVLSANAIGNSDYSNEVAIGSEVLNTNEELFKKILVFPNPATETVFINNESNTKLHSVTIRNPLGQLVKNAMNTSNQQQIELTIKDLSKGLYLIHIESDKGTLVKQLIIE